MIRTSGVYVVIDIGFKEKVDHILLITTNISVVTGLDISKVGIDYSLNLMKNGLIDTVSNHPTRNV